MSGDRRAHICALSIGYWLVVGAPVSAQVSYQYDELGRVVKATDSRVGYEQTYAYDALGNRTNVSQAIAAFAISDVTVTEGGAASFTITKTGTTALTIAVGYATANGTAVAPGDYTALSSSVSFAPVDTSKVVTVSTIDDVVVESAETFFVNLTSAPGGFISDSQGQGTINDNDAPPAPSFSINDATVTEGGNAVFTVTKTGTTSSNFSVNFATANGTATAGSDYTAQSNTLTFLAADTTKTITIATTDDTAVESAETFFVNLSGATGGSTISDNQGAGTINDNDTAGVSFSVNDISIGEGANGVITVTKSGTAAGNVSVNYATADNTALAGSDYTAASGTLTFTSADTTKTVTLRTRGNTVPEPTETFFFNLSSPSAGTTISDNQGVVTIIDDD